jgi:hypothetical protein
MQKARFFASFKGQGKVSLASVKEKRKSLLASFYGEGGYFTFTSFFSWGKRKGFSRFFQGRKERFYSLLSRENG